MATKTLLFVGTYNRIAPNLKGTPGKGITVCSLDRATGQITPLSVTEGIDNPSYFATDSTGRRLAEAALA